MKNIFKICAEEIINKIPATNLYWSFILIFLITFFYLFQKKKLFSNIFSSISKAINFLIKNKKKEENIQKDYNKESEPENILKVELKNNKHILIRVEKENENLQENNFPLQEYNHLIKFPQIKNKFSILTYNILCQKYMTRRDRKDLNLEKRMLKIKEEISAFDADVVCLQECVYHTIKLYMESFFAGKYEVYYMENYGSNFYNLIAFKKDKFEMKENKKINLDDVKCEGNRGVFVVELEFKKKEKQNEKTHLNEKEKENSNENKVSLIQGKDLDKNSMQENKKNSDKKKAENKEANKSNPEKVIYNYKNFIEYNKIENKNKLVIYNVHLPWRPIFDYEKCLILNKIIDDISGRNQRNYLILGDFNSKPNSLLMRMIYFDKFINEIKYFKNILNFKANYFRKSDPDIKINSSKILDENSPIVIAPGKNQFIKDEPILGKSIYKNPSEKSRIEIIKEFDILKEIKNLKKEENVKEQEKNCTKKDKKNLDIKIPNTKEDNNDFWSKLSKHKKEEINQNMKIREFDLLKEMFTISNMLDKEKQNFKFDSKDKLLLKEMMKLLTLSNLKSRNNEEEESNKNLVNYSYNNINYSNQQNINNFIGVNNFEIPYYNFSKSNTNSFINYNINNNNNITANLANKEFDIYSKVKKIVENFKNLFIKYKFKSAYESYSITIENNIELINSLENNNNNNDKEKNNKETKKNKESDIRDYFQFHPPYTNFTENFKDTLDYVFYSKHLVLERILKLPELEELLQEGFLPSTNHPSDHLPIYAEFYTS